LKVAFVTRNFPPVICGVGDYTEHLARAAMEAGHEVTVLTGPHREAAGANQAPTGLRVLPILSSTRLGLGSVLRHIHAEHPDLVSLQYTPVSFGRYGVAPEAALLPGILRAGGTPVVSTLHETYLPNPRSLGFRALSAVQAAQLVPIVAASTRVIVNSERALLNLKRAFPWARSTLRYAPNASSIPLVQMSEAQHGEVRQRWDLEGSMILATFGTMRPDKDMITVVRALAALAPKRPLKLLCIGYAGGPRGCAMKARVQEEADLLGVGDLLVWTGSLERDDVSRCLGVSDLFILPFVGGPSGNRSSLSPALAHGLPVVAFAGSESSHLADQQAVLLVAPRDPAALAQKIDQLLGNQRQREALGASGREAYERMWTWQHVLSATLGGL
jgi:glycosyltransferase involved in cell wall biosynthesis